MKLMIVKSALGHTCPRTDIQLVLKITLEIGRQFDKADETHDDYNHHPTSPQS
jgi:hypothetical protein